MKKWILFGLALGLSMSLLGQTQLAAKKQGLSFVLGPNWDKAIRFGLLDDDILFRTGYSLGLDYFQTLTPRWEAKISARYHLQTFAEINYEIQFDTIGSAVFPVSSLKKIVTTRHHAWGISAGVRRLGKPARLRWFWNGEAGATGFGRGGDLPAFTFGLGTGWEWSSVKKDWGISFQPMVRCLFWGSQDQYSDHILLSLELGLRRSF